MRELDEHVATALIHTKSKVSLSYFNPDFSESASTHAHATERLKLSPVDDELKKSPSVEWKLAVVVLVRNSVCKLAKTHSQNYPHPVGVTILCLTSDHCPRVKNP